MVDKIKGEFLKIEKEEFGYYMITYADESGDILWVRLMDSFAPQQSQLSQAEIEKLETALSQTRDTATQKDIQSRLTLAKFNALWPEMYKAHCRGESLSKFFEKKAEEDSVLPQGQSNPAYDDALFQKAFPVFTKSITNLLQECYENFGSKVSEAAKKLEKPGWTVDPFMPRYEVYRDIARKIGEDFLAEFRNIIKPYCQNLSDSSVVELLKLFNLRYNGAITNAEQGLKRFTASRGMRDNIEGYLLPARGIYRSAQHKYWNQVEAEILKHNLEHPMKTEAKEAPHAISSKKKAKARKTKSEMKAIYNSLVTFHFEKRSEYEKKNGTRYGAAKYADVITAKEIWKVHHVRVSPRNVRDAMSRN
jgi:hypothetical protein